MCDDPKEICPAWGHDLKAVINSVQRHLGSMREHTAHLDNRIDELLRANTEYLEENRELKKKLAGVIEANKILERTIVTMAVETTLPTLVEREDDAYIPLNGR